MLKHKMKNFTHTKIACYLGYITQAIVNNLAPLLFLIFNDMLGVSLGQVTILITVNFGVQLTVDLISSKFVDKIGYRPCIVAAHLLAGTGFICLALLPTIMTPFPGLLIAVILYSCGGGLIEVIISPLIEACPTKNKSSEMSLLHSFYCWGSVIVIAVSTLFLFGLGKEQWQLLVGLWAILPIVNAVYFCCVPITTLNETGESLSVKELLRSKKLWLFALLVLAAGAAEISMSQWASTFAENALGVPKWIGDLAGPCLFAALMGIARLAYSFLGKKLPLKICLLCSSILCVVCYFIAGFAAVPALALAGCALCGFSVGILWPGVFSVAAESLPNGGTTMFAFLAVAGDLGGACGPSLVGTLAGCLNDNLQTGLLFGSIFPILFVVLTLCLVITKKTHK